MSTFKARGIVLHTVDIGESDKLMVLLAKEYGKLIVSAKGARKPKSKLLAGTALFTYADFIIFDGVKFLSASQVDVIESFYGIRDDYERFCHGSYFLELCNKFMLENVRCDEVCLLLLKTLSALAKGKLDNALVRCVFEFKFLQLNGFSPGLDACTRCGGKVPRFTFFSENGVVCESCVLQDKRAFKLQEASLRAISYILDSEPQNLYHFTVSERVLGELKIAADLFISCHLDLNLKSKKLLKEF